MKMNINKQIMKVMMILKMKIIIVKINMKIIMVIKIKIIIMIKIMNKKAKMNNLKMKMLYKPGPLKNDKV